MPRVIDTTTLATGTKFSFVEKRLRRGDGTELVRQFVRHPGAVVIVPLLEDGRVVLIRTYRPAVEAWLWECPAGTREAGEEPLDTALRETEEETGYRAARAVLLGSFYTSPGMSDERMLAYAATGLTPVGTRHEADETIEVHAVPAAEALAMIARGELADAKSIVALLLARDAGHLPAPRSTDRAVP